VTASFLALGDSYTIGEGVAEADRWPVQLARRLRAAGVEIEAPRIVARTGWTTEELQAAIAAAAITGRFDLVTLLIGVNDQYREYGLERYLKGFGVLLQAGLAFAKLPTRLIVLSIPDWGVTPFAEGRDRSAVGREIDNFNQAARGLAMESGARFMDVTPASRQAAQDRALLAGDGLHPSALMYEMWVDDVFPIAMDALGASERTRTQSPRS
jgi:lysophospholipase L1-like esterase